MAVTISFLGETLIAVFAHEWPQTTVHTDMIHYIAELGERVAAGNTHQKLIRTASILVFGEKLHVASFNFVAVALLIRIVLLKPRPLLLWLPLVVVVFIVMEAIHSFLDGIIGAVHIHVLVPLDE